MNFGEEGGRALAPGREKAGWHEGRSQSLKRKLTTSAERLCKHSGEQRQRGTSPSVTPTQCECHQRAGDSRMSYNDGTAFATTLR